MVKNIDDRQILITDLQIHLVWIPLAVLFISVAGVLPFRYSLRVLQSISFWVITILLVLLPLFKYSYFLPKVKNWQKDRKSADLAMNLYEKLTPFGPLVLGMIAAFFISMEVISLKTPDRFWGCFFTILGTAITVSIFFGVRFVDVYRLWAIKIPLAEKSSGYSLMGSVSVTATAGLCGMFFLTIASLFAPLAQTESFNERVLYNTVPLALFGFILGIWNLFHLGGSIADRQTQITEFIEKKLTGDNSSDPLPITSRNELGYLSAGLNTMHQNTRLFLIASRGKLARAKEVADGLVSNAEKVQTSVNHIKANIDNVEKKVVDQSTGVFSAQTNVTSILSTIESLDRTIDDQVHIVSQSAASIEEMVNNIHSVAKILEDNTAAIDTLVAEAQSAQESTVESSKTSKQVQEASESLLEAGSVIQHIASQTNLLAMNAAIEASYSKEAGQGFEVVASEIRKLAEDASKQGKNISAVLKEVKVEIDNVAASSVLVQKQFSKMFNISAGIKKQEAVIMQAMIEQSEGGKQVLEAINQISEITNELKEDSARMLESSKQAGEKMTRLSQSTLQINRSASTMGQDLQEILTSVSAVARTGKQNKTSITRLSDELAQMQF